MNAGNGGTADGERHEHGSVVSPLRLTVTSPAWPLISRARGTVAATVAAGRLCQARA